MKDKRNCSQPYPVYPQMMVPPMPMPYTTGYSQNYSNTQQTSNLEDRLNNLESRISKLESMLNNNNQYNGSNYYMV